MVQIRIRQRDGSNPRGFALVVALGWMGFMVLLVLALGTTVRIETGVSGVALRRLAAREAARLGLMLAVGQLQEEAGPDRRVTGPAGGPGWCGVWNTAGPGGGPRMLVSGGDGGAAPGRWRMSPLQWKGGPRVEVPFVELRDGRGGVAARLAWWTEEQGTRASVGKHAGLGHLSGWKGLRDDAPEVLELCTPLRYRYGAVAGLGKEGPPLVAAGAGLPGPVSAEAAALLARAPDSLTWSSLGVLCDTGSGGLRRDLAHPETDAGEVLGDAVAVRSLLARWPPQEERHRMEGHPDGSVGDGLPGRATPVLMHEFGLYVGVFRENVGAETRLKAHLSVRAEIWNPYAVPLQMTPRGQPDLRIVVRGLPQIEADWTTGSGTAMEAAGSFRFDPGALEADADADGVSFGRLGVEGFPVDIHGDFTSADTRLKAARAHAPLGVAVADGTPGGDDIVALRAGPSELEVELRTADGALLQRFSGIAFEGFSSAGVRFQELLPVYAARSPAYGDYQALYHFRWRDGVYRSAAAASAPMEQWFSRVDPRTVDVDLSDGGDPALAGLLEVDANPAANVLLQTNFFPGDPEFLNGGNFVRAFDLPLAPVVSLGWLQHLQVHGRRPFSIGNPWGGALNHVFDRYFLSGVPYPAGEGGVPGAVGALPNPHLVHLAGPGDPQSGLATAVRSGQLAGRVLVNGAFNVNSTSAGAWRAVLGALRTGEWGYRQGYGVSGVTRPGLRNGFFRFPQGARSHYKSPFLRFPAYPEVSQADKARWYKWQAGEPDWINAFDVGLRELRERDVDALAAAVAGLVRERSAPFLSMAEFVNSGLLQDAIDRTEINSVAAGTYDQQNLAGDALVFPRYCPSFLTQADLLSTLAPLLTVRSDTFVIRVRAEVPLGPREGSVARAGCEARVQRLPELLDADDPGKGRRFQILSVRWLGADER